MLVLAMQFSRGEGPLAARAERWRRGTTRSLGRYDAEGVE